MIGPQDDRVTDPNLRVTNGQSMQALAALNERAREIFRRVIDGNYWAAFGYVAAEAELAREGR